ncbi:MAG: isoleucine--tRNA ligase [Bacteroidota bacterium]
MNKQYKTYTSLNLSQTAKDVQKKWDQEHTFLKSITSREGNPPFVFYEGPPSANGLPGIHHVMARSIKDIFCRYKTQKGFQVKRKAGWDTHGLPIELSVEKALGITKEDIGKKITVEQYNIECRKDVMKYTDVWADVTAKMGYWVDMEHPYITYDNKYIESVWWLLHNLYNKGMLYKGYTIQPYSPAAGTGLSSHELNQPGCYRDVKDRTAVAMFKVLANQHLKGLSILQNINTDIYFLAWTTTPWTLPSNTALAVGKNIDYVVVETFHPFLHTKVKVILAKDLVNKHFPEKNAAISFDDYKAGDKAIPYDVVATIKGSDLEGISYEQLLPFAQPQDGEAFRVIMGDFVTTEDGTGIVHIAPSFGADDFRVAKQNGIGSLTLVDKRGKFLPEVKDELYLYGEEYVKEAYLNEEEKNAEFERQKKILETNGKIKELKAYLSVDERIVLKLQEEGKLFKKESYEHSYPHCWRTDKPVLYYPLDSWFIKTTAYKERMIELNKTINWKPESTGTGRFGNWLENLNDWNLSRSRFWGIPVPIWTSEDKSEQICIESVAHLQNEIENAIAKNVMKSNPLAGFKHDDFSEENYNSFDLHKPYADQIVLERNGKKLFREPDLIDVWFDSGAMPYAQLHYPFENKELIDQKKYYPADFIAEGVDQTRGWFFTLHAIGTMCFDSVAFKNVVSNGLVLDKNGQKMSKRLGNAVDPFDTIEKYGPDATRWYMITNAAPWDNLKFDIDGIAEVQRKFFGTLHNTYSFFALYANVDGFCYAEKEIPLQERTEIDRWIISELNTLIKNVDAAYADYEPHRAGRLIETFVDEHLSNWYVRLCRRRFWKGEYTTDKIAAYQTLYHCLQVVAKLSAAVAPFFMERLFTDLNSITNRNKAESVHLSDFPVAVDEAMDAALEERMELAQKISSMVLSIRKKENIRVRQPLAKIQIPVLDDAYRAKIEAVKDLILSEVNVKSLELADESQTQIVKQLKLNFKTLGKKCGKHMKAVQNYAASNAASIIADMEKNARFELTLENELIVLEPEDTEIIPVDIPGWKVANAGQLTVALDVTITEELRQEGLARELVNRIQNVRKDRNFDLTDRIVLKIKEQKEIKSAVNHNLEYICTEILADKIEFVSEMLEESSVLLELEENLSSFVQIIKV